MENIVFHLLFSRPYLKKVQAVIRAAQEDQQINSLSVFWLMSPYFFFPQYWVVPYFSPLYLILKTNVINKNNLIDSDMLYEAKKFDY